MNKLISIILPVYNGENTICQTIDSILTQSYQNFQLIIVDDGSKDSTQQRCKKYLKNRKINYYKLENGGVSKARNFGLEKAKGEYITFIDSDDLYEKFFLETMLYQIQKGFDLVTCGYQNFEKSNKIFLANIEIAKTKAEYIKQLQNKYLFNQIWNKIYSSEIIKEHEIKFDESLSIAEDWNFNLDYLKFSKAYTVCNRSLYLYRISNSGLGFKYRKDASEIKLSLLEKMKYNFFITAEEKNYIYDSYIRQYYAYFSNIMDKRNLDKIGIKKNKIYSIINSVSFTKRINECTSNNLKNKILLLPLKKKKFKTILFLSKIANIYDKIQKKRNFGI